MADSVHVFRCGAAARIAADTVVAMAVNSGVAVEAILMHSVEALFSRLKIVSESRKRCLGKNLTLEGRKA